MSLAILVLAEKRLAFKPGNTARNFGANRKHASRENRQISPGILGLIERRLAFWFRQTNTPNLDWGKSPGISGLTEKNLAFKLENTARNFGSDRKMPRIQTGTYRQEFWF